MNYKWLKICKTMNAKQAGIKKIVNEKRINRNVIYKPNTKNSNIKQQIVACYVVWLVTQPLASTTKDTGNVFSFLFKV